MDGLGWIVNAVGGGRRAEFPTSTRLNAMRRRGDRGHGQEIGYASAAQQQPLKGPIQDEPRPEIEK